MAKKDKDEKEKKHKKDKSEKKDKKEKKEKKDKKQRKLEQNNLVCFKLPSTIQSWGINGLLMVVYLFSDEDLN